MNIATTSDTASQRNIFEQRHQQWRAQNLFVDRIYQVCNNVHPGIGLERSAVDHIQGILIRILLEILESQPKKIEDMERCLRACLPASLCHWVKQFQQTNESVHNLSSKKIIDKRNANARTLVAVYHSLQMKIKEHMPYKVDEKIVLYILSVIEYVTGDILKIRKNKSNDAESVALYPLLFDRCKRKKKNYLFDNKFWKFLGLLFSFFKLAGNYVNNIRKGDSTISLQNLKIALSVDKTLMDLMDMLYNEEETSTIGVLNELNDDSWKISQEMSFEKVTKDFNHEEERYLRDLNLIIHVFRRRFESILDTDDKFYLDEIFGNILEIHELTVKVQRILEDAVEMSDTPCVGASLWELAEAYEFDVYITYMEIFKNSFAILDRLLNEEKYSNLFEVEITPGGQTFRLASKYVLPTLLQFPILHFFKYVEYINVLIHLSKAADELEDLKSAKSYFGNAAVRIEQCCSSLIKLRLKNEQTARNSSESHASQQLRRIQEVQRSIELWEGKEIGYTCSQIIREGNLHLLRPYTSVSSVDTLKKSRGSTDRFVFLFDHLLVLCKAHRSAKSEKPVYKFKSKVLIRKTDIFDLKDTEELQHAFKIESRSSSRERNVSNTWVLFCRSSEEKDSWMSDLVLIQTKSLLDRILDNSLKEEEKRIPLILPGPDQYRFADQDCDENIAFEDYTSSSGIPVVKHATVLKLVERLTYHLYTDNNYVRTFLTTYRSFCQPSELLQFLIERFNVPTPHQLQIVEENNSSHSRGLLSGPYATVHSQGLCGHIPPSTYNRIEQSYQRFRKEYQKPIQCRVLSVIRQWVNGHWYDFESDPSLLEALRHFLDETDKQTKVINQHKKWCKSIQTCIDRKLRLELSSGINSTNTVNEQIDLSHANSFAPPKPPIVWHSAKKGEIETYDLLSLHPLEIGRQITLLQFDLYRAIKPIELVGSAWTKRDKNRRSPQLLKLIDHSTMLTYWIARSIVETPSLEERVGMFSRVLEVMMVFEELNNFTGLVALYSALNSSSVYRLRACWERIDREKQVCYEKFKKLCNPHWKEMIERLKSINPPCVPFFGHYLSKIFFYEEGNSTFVQNNDEDLSHDQVGGEEPHTTQNSRKVMVSFVKCRRIAAIISDIQMYQNQPYSLQIEPSIRQFFEAIDPLNGFDDKESFETYMWDQSLKIEPKDSDKMEILKPIRAAHVIRSPGIKPPKVLNTPASTSGGPSNHYAGYRGSGRGFTSHFNTYSSAEPNNALQTSLSTNVVANEEKSSHLGIVEINPGYQPRYLGDARRGRYPPALSLVKPPPLSSPRTRKDKASSTPPSPRGQPAVISPNDPPPPLYPRRMSPHFFPPTSFAHRCVSDLHPSTTGSSTITNVCSPTPVTTASLISVGHTMELSTSASPNDLEEGESHDDVVDVFGVTTSNQDHLIDTQDTMIPQVPPRKKADILPAPLSPDTIRVVLDGEMDQKSKTTDRLSIAEKQPQLYPRRVNFEPPPRPPKTKLLQNRIAFEPVQTCDNGEESGKCSPPPPLPPKTYKRRQL